MGILNGTDDDEHFETTVQSQLVLDKIFTMRYRNTSHPLSKTKGCAHPRYEFEVTRMTKEEKLTGSGDFSLFYFKAGMVLYIYNISS